MQYLVTVRGMLKDPANAQKVHDATVAAVSPMGRQMGNKAHQTFLNTQNPKEFFAMDVWTNIEAIQKLYSDPNLAVEFGKLFEGQPEVSVWSNTGWMSFMDA